MSAAELKTCPGGAGRDGAGLEQRAGADTDWTGLGWPEDQRGSGLAGVLSNMCALTCLLPGPLLDSNQIDVGEEKPRQVISGLRNFVPLEQMQVGGGWGWRLAVGRLELWGLWVRRGRFATRCTRAGGRRVAELFGPAGDWGLKSLELKEGRRDGVEGAPQGRLHGLWRAGGLRRHVRTAACVRGPQRGYIGCLKGSQGFSWILPADAESKGRMDYAWGNRPNPHALPYPVPCQAR